jgi:signal recognition particle subunit SRP54
LGESLKIPVFGMVGEKKASTIVKKGMEHFKSYQIKIIDTSGRHALEADLIEEIKNLKNIAKPDEILLVIDATVGQQAGIQAKAFHDAVKVTGVFLSKLDGTAKGGGALSAVAVTNAPILFIGTGEHLYDLELFEHERFVSKLLGMGDIKSLLESAKEMDIDEQQMEKTMEKMLSGKFNLKDMYEIWEQISKPGLLKKMLSAMPMFKMPGMDKLDGDLAENSEEKLKKYRIIMDSMTFNELENPEIIKSSRISRISLGSGKDETEVRELLKEHKKLKKAMKSFKGNRKMMRMLKKQMKTGDLDF